jgi:hypothetical protein
VELERRASARADAHHRNLTSYGLTINLEASVGVGGEVSLLGSGGEWSATAGLEASFNGTWAQIFRLRDMVGRPVTRS